MSKAQLSAAIGYSTRWIELRMSGDGLPYYRLPNGTARYLLSEVKPYVERWTS
jgi:hypothetical protein